MANTPPVKIIGARVITPANGNAAESELKLKNITKYTNSKFVLICRAQESPVLRASQSNGNKYLSVTICDVRIRHRSNFHSFSD